MQKIKEGIMMGNPNQGGASESDAALQQILKTSCLLNEIKRKPLFNNNASNNLEFLLHLFTKTNIFPEIIQNPTPPTNEVSMNPLKMLSVLAENQKEISSALYNTVMRRQNINRNLL